MPEESQTEPPELDANTALAQHRTTLALERTLLSWVRTAFASVTAAIAINRLLATEQFLESASSEVWIPAAEYGSVVLSLATTLLLTMATSQYVRQSRAVGAATGTPSPISWPAILASILVIAIGGIGSLLMIITTLWQPILVP